VIVWVPGAGNITAGVLASGVLGSMDPLVLQCGEERLGHSAMPFRIWRGEMHPLLAELTFQYSNLMPQGEDFHVLVPVAHR
jgi:hypothetical protein